MRKLITVVVLGVSGFVSLGGCGAANEPESERASVSESPLAADGGVDSARADTGTPAEAGSCTDCPSPAPSIMTNGIRTFVAGNKPDKRCTLPASCKCIKGDCEWLQCFRDGQYGPLAGYSWLVSCGLSSVPGSMWACPLTTAAENQIAAACKNKPTDAERLACIAAALKPLLDPNPNNVCRHWAMCVDDIGSILGIPTTYHLGSTSVGGHAWSESTVQVDGGAETIVTDAYNGIVMVCDKPPVVLGDPSFP